MYVVKFGEDDRWWVYGRDYSQLCRWLEGYSMIALRPELNLVKGYA
jgi:hypothetical protein